MIKLTIDFQVTLALPDAFTPMVGISKIMAFGNERAIAFGWGTQLGVRAGDTSEYWLTAVSREGVVTRTLLPAWTHGNEGLLAPRRPDVPPQAFRLGGRFGLLISPEALLLFDSIEDPPARIAIDLHFSGLGEQAHARHAADSYYQVVHCGSGSDGIVPVVLSAPTGRGAGRHLALLEIDAESRQARWLHTRIDGSPRTLDSRDYAGFDASGMLKNMAQIDPQMVHPVVTDCAWLDKRWLVYAAGHDKNLVRFGIPIGVLTRNQLDLSLLDPLFRPSEQSYVTICASLDRLIVSPLNKSGPHKGKQTIVILADGQEHAITLPRGCATHQLLDHDAGCYWLAPMPTTSNRLPMTLTACQQV
jgi:hypothetical protein